LNHASRGGEGTQARLVRRILLGLAEFFAGIYPLGRDQADIGVLS
jgi:hypothetical protein